MRRYSAEDEQAIRLSDAVGQWTRAGLLRPEQQRRIQELLSVNLRRTGLMLRVGLALFTFLVVGASAGLIFVTLKPRAEIDIGITMGVVGVACLIAADVLVSRFAFYRHGVEEALAVSGAAFCGLGGAFLFVAPTLAREGVVIAAGLGLCAIVGAAVYVRFGFRYAAVAALLCAALMPLPLGTVGRIGKHLLAAATCLAGFVVARQIERRASDERLRADAPLLQASALAGVYLSLNLHLLSELWGTSSAVAGWFRWSTFAAVWTLPIVTALDGLRRRERWLMDAGLVFGLLTLVTNKPYLGLARQTWDPIILGLLLVGVAVVIRRWLASGLGGERNGFTPVQLLESEANAVQAASLASAAIHSRPAIEPTPTSSAFSGGRSGGAGAGDKF